MIGEACSARERIQQGLALGVAAQPDRRQDARFLLKDVRGRIDWQEGPGEVSRLVEVLNISGGGAAVQLEDPPKPGQEVGLRIDHERCGMGRVTAIVQAVELDGAPGCFVVRLRFARWIRLDWMAEIQRDRRLWERYPTRESRAILTWLEGFDERTIHGELLNISGGGAAITASILPPTGVSLWLLLEAGVCRTNPVAPVEARLVFRSIDPSGRMMAHLQFLEPCPMDLFELAVHGSTEVRPS